MVPNGSDGCSFGGGTPRREGLESKEDGAGAVFGGEVATTVALVGVAGLGADGTGWEGADDGGGATGGSAGITVQVR